VTYATGKNWNYDDCRKVQDLELLTVHDQVWLPYQRTEGQVVATSSPCSYIVKTPKGQYRRNRSHINLMLHPQDNISEETSPVDELLNEETNPKCDNSSVATWTRSGRVVKCPKRFDPAEDWRNKGGCSMTDYLYCYWL